MKTKLIIALDNLLPEEVKDIIQEISTGASEYTLEVMYKFNDMIGRIGFEGIKKLIEGTPVRIMLDPKWNDIPNTIRNYLTQLHNSGLHKSVDLLTIHANSGSATLKEAMKVKKELGLDFDILAITVLTSQDDEDTAQIYDENPKHSVLKLTKLALDSGVDGVVCSGQETKILREVFSESDFKILNPGVRFAGGDTHDQKRVMTPKDAVERGVDYVVMGRPILQSEDKPKTVRQFFTEIQGVEQISGTNFEFEKLLYTGTWKDIFSYIGAFYFRPEGGKYCRFTSKVLSNAYINIGAIERNYGVIERATTELAEKFREQNILPDVIVGAQMGSVRISLYLAEKLGVEESVYTEKTDNDNNNMALKRHAINLKGKKVVLSEDIVSRGTTIQKMTNLIHEAGGEVIAIACVGNRYEQDSQNGIPIISCFTPPKFELYWDDNTPEEQRKDFPRIPDGIQISEKPKNEWNELVKSMRK